MRVILLVGLLTGCTTTTKYSCLGQIVETQDKGDTVIIYAGDPPQEVEKNSTAHKVFLNFCRPVK